MSFVWTLAEHTNGSLKEVAFELLGWGRPIADQMGTKVASLIVGESFDDVELQKLIEYGADEVYVVEHPRLREFICEAHSSVVSRLIHTYKPSVVLAAATTTGRTLMPHVAVKVHTGLTADCTELSVEDGTDNLLQTRPAIGGNIMATIRTPNHRPQMATVRPRSSKPLDRDPGRVGKIIRVPYETLTEQSGEPSLEKTTQIIGYRRDATEVVNLENTEVVIAGGRGLKNAEGFALLQELASAVGGVVGATRDAVDRGWIGYPHQIGLSGKTISAKLYVAIGISGSIQHLAGIKTCEKIISINSDPDAPIHQVADLAVVGDLFQIVPELLRQLRPGAGETELDAFAARPDAKEVKQEPPRPREKSAGTKRRRISTEQMGELRALLGDGLLLSSSDVLEQYSHDETNADEYGCEPDVVVLPETPEQVAAIVKFANRHGIPITPRGAGSGLSGGSIPTSGGIVLSVEKMNRLLELDTDNMLAVVEAGMVTNEFATAVAEAGLFFAGYPMSLETCFIGGNIAENAGGGKAVKYGVTGRYVSGVEVVTPTGDIVWLGGKTTKDVSGYDLKQLIIGSEGTLGIVTKAIIKLTGLPKVSSVALALFDTTEAAIGAVPAILTSGMVPSSIEFMDQISVRMSCSHLNESLPYENCGAMLLIEMDGQTSEQVQSELFAVGTLCEEYGATVVYVADDATSKERIWNVRRNIAEAIKATSPVQSLEDIVVPTAQIPELMPELARMSERYGMQIPCYGHAGDGNLHATLVKPQAMSSKEWKTKEDACLLDLYNVVSRLGGKISGEHGIGIKRKRYFQEIADPVELELMRAIKRAWDPNNIMNPGKIFDGGNSDG